MAGSGTQIYRDITKMPTSAADLLKAYHLFLAACPFRKISNLFSNKTIMNVAKNATRLHIIDFGVLYGFQWPSLIQRLWLHSLERRIITSLRPCLFHGFR
ncbi:unnamed protein product [Ilex paraguariensis]|uniref:Uncharacterized protein n=1 Tax=Ilex paraguariensis TaxID=185542 RepID=A0ABC8QW93_9AQUA